MKQNQPVNSSRMRIHRLFSSATESASAAMSQWTQGQITLSLEALHEVAIEEVSATLNVGDELMTMVVLTLEGEFGGQMILAFDEKNGRQLAASLMGRELSLDPEWSDLEKSALSETGNILGCAYMNTLSEVTGTELIPSPPHFVQDYGASILQQAIMPQAMVSDRVMICRTIFQREGETLNWNVFFVPTEGLLRKFQSASQPMTSASIMKRGCSTEAWFS